MSDFTSQDWIWIANASMFFFCMLDGSIKGRDILMHKIKTKEIESPLFAIVFFVLIYTAIIYLLYWISFIIASPTLTFVVLLFETSLRLWGNHNDTKSLTDYDE